MQFNAPGKLAKAITSGMEKQAGGSVAKFLRNRLKTTAAGSGVVSSIASAAKKGLSSKWRAGVSRAASLKYPLLTGAAGLGMTLAAPTVYQKVMEKGLNHMIGKDPYAHLRPKDEGEQQDD